MNAARTLRGLSTLEKRVGEPRAGLWPQADGGQDPSAAHLTHSAVLLPPGPFPGLREAGRGEWAGPGGGPGREEAPWAQLTKGGVL